MKATGTRTLGGLALRRVVWAFVAALLLVMLPGCGDGAANAEKVESLEQEITYLRERSKADRERLTELEKKSARLEKENGDAKRSLRDLEAKLEAAKKELAGPTEPENAAEVADEAKGGDEPKAVDAVNGEDVAEEGGDAAPAVMDKEPSRTEKSKLAKEIVYGAVNAIVTVTGDEESGFGVLVTAGDKVWIYTAASLVAANRRLKITAADGSAIEKFGAFELAPDANLARLEAQTGADGALRPGTGAEEVKSASPLLALDEGLTMDGRASAVEGATMKVSGDLVDLPPGSPVFHGESGELIGILGVESGAERTLWTSGTTSSGADKVAQRIDRPIDWTAIPIGTFLNESRIIDEIDRITKLAEAFLALSPDESGLDLNAAAGPGITAREVFAANKSLSLVRSAAELNKWLEERGARSSPVDRRRKISSVYDGIHSKVQAQVRAFEKKKFSPSNAAAAAQSLQWCKDADRRLTEFLRGLEED